MSNLEIILSKLDKVKQSGKRYMARCPAHKDGRPSLLLSEENGKVGIHCFASCSADDIMSSIGMETKDLYPDSDYDKSKWRLEKLAEEGAHLKVLLGMYEQGMKAGTLTNAEKAKYRATISEFNFNQKAIRSLMR